MYKHIQKLYTQRPFSENTYFLIHAFSKVPKFNKIDKDLFIK